MDLCVWAPKETTIYRVCLRTRAKSNESCSWKKHCFSGKTGHVATVPLEQRRTVNSEWYTTIFLPEVFGEIRKTNKRRRIIVHHDNASSHTSAQNNAFLTGQNVKLMGYTPYNPDLAPNDFFLLPHIKKKCVVNDFRRQKTLLKRSKTMFWRCLNRSEKSASTIDLSACKSV